VEDRFTRGFIAGLIGGIAMNILNYIARTWLHLPRSYVVNYTGVVIFGHQPDTTAEYLFSLFSQIGFAGFLGIIFAYLLLVIRNKNIVLKGVIFANVFWFFVFSLGTVCKLPLIQDPSIATVISHFINASFYGLVLALTLYRLNRIIGQ